MIVTLRPAYGGTLPYAGDFWVYLQHPDFDRGDFNIVRAWRGRGFLNAGDSSPYVLSLR